MTNSSAARAAVIAFAATLFVAGAAAFAMAVDRYALPVFALDREVVLLFAPLCLLVFGVIVEVVRMTATSGTPAIAIPARRVIWTDTSAD